MKMKWMVGALSVAMSAPLFAADATAPALATTEDKVSYSIGSDLGKNLKRQGITINPTVFAKGMEDGMRGGKLLMSEEEMKQVLSDFEKEMMNKRASEFNQKAEDNKVKGETFLKENKAKSGVVSLPSGLQYKIIKEGTGVKPTKEDMVTVEYTGRLLNGEVFDSTEKAGKPVSFKLTQVIPGWTEALQLMPAGSTWEVYIPAKLAYGSRNVGGAIGPNETLIFNVHLIDVKKDDKQAVKK
ncbi:MAG: FKBP-type peptidyl-prolyl cis-trans isomerase [Gammaproteobacteria bacterium]|nr:FKBP-type peptidyl-prolyl cis-trans isomerase [Gammaproteobacteria bacterium]